MSLLDERIKRMNDFKKADQKNDRTNRLLFLGIIIVTIISGILSIINAIYSKTH